VNIPKFSIFNHQSAEIEQRQLFKSFVGKSLSVRVRFIFYVIHCPLTQLKNKNNKNKRKKKATSIIFFNLNQERGKEDMEYTDFAGWCPELRGI